MTISTLAVWPASGSALTLDDGVTVVPSGGAALTYTAEIRRRLTIDGTLLTYDPSEDPVTWPDTPVSPVDAGEAIAAATDLDTRRGSYDGQPVVASYRTTQGDGGGGLFEWRPTSTASRDAGTIYGTYGTGRWVRVTRGALDVVHFGADPTGVADSTSAVAACLAAAYAQTATHVLFPRGVYRISTVALPDISLQIEGTGATIQTTSAGSFAFTSAFRRRASYYGLTFTGVGSGVSQTLSPSGTQSYDTVFEKCSFTLGTTKTAIKLTGVREVTISQCYFEDCIGVHLLQTCNTHVVGSQFKNCAAGCFGDGSATGSAYDAGLILTACTMLGCVYGVRTIGWDHTGVVNSMIDYCDHPVDLLNCDGATIQSTYVSGRAAYPAINVDTNLGSYSGEKCKHVVIDSCHIIQHYSGATDSVAIAIGDVDYVDITRSEIGFWRNYGILITGANDYLRISSNDIEPSNPVAGAYGLYGTAGGDSTWMVRDNHFSAGYSVGNTNYCAFSGNANFNLSDVGSATVLNGNTSVAVTFSVALAEAPLRIFLTPRQNAGAPWATGVSTTGMTINIAAAAAGNVQVDYDVSVPWT